MLSETGISMPVHSSINVVLAMMALVEGVHAAKTVKITEDFKPVFIRSPAA
jgi:hypothetical protein